MSIMGDFASQTGAFDLAIIAATISILIGGMLFGVGIGLGVRRLRFFGLEEIGQGIISAAMVGGIVAFAAILNASAQSMAPQEALSSCPSASPSPYSYYECSLRGLSGSFLRLGSALYRAADITGFASSLVIFAGVVTAQPFFALESASHSLSDASGQSYSAHALCELEIWLAESVRSSALELFLPVGVILRAFFATRKLGAAAMAIAVSAYMVYPLLFLYTFQGSQSEQAAADAAQEAEKFNSDFASIPLLDLDETSAVRDAIEGMSEGDFPSKIQPLFPLSFRALSLSQADLAIFPILSLILTAVAALELYALFSMQVFVPHFSAV